MATVLIAEEAGWAQETVWTLLKKRRKLPLLGIEQVVSQYTDRSIGRDVS
jgi:hypothetical protein